MIGSLFARVTRHTGHRRPVRCAQSPFHPVDDALDESVRCGGRNRLDAEQASPDR